MQRFKKVATHSTETEQGNKNISVNENVQRSIVDNYELVCPTKKSLKVLYANVRSLVKPGKFDELNCIVQLFPSVIHLIALSETWIKNDEEARRFNLPGYTHYCNHRINTKGGGISAYVHNSLKSSLIEDLTLDDNHYLWIQLEKMSLEVGIVYKPGRTSDKNFLETFLPQIEKRK